jgi:hypothetical protein
LVKKRKVFWGAKKMTARNKVQRTRETEKLSRKEKVGKIKELWHHSLSRICYLKLAKGMLASRKRR